MTSVFAPLDNYCERTAHGLYEEPINAITNIAFLLAAWFLYEQYKKQGVKDKESHSLIVLIGVIGIGSFAFHTFATYITMLADVIPIIFFVCYFLWVAMRNFLKLTKAQTAMAFVVFFIVTWAINQIPSEYTFNGSISYFSCMLALLVFGLVLRKKHHAAAPAFFKAIGIFLVSLTFRSIDMAVCDSFALGTHFMWHILNGLLLYTLAKSFLDHKAKHAN